MASRTAVPFLTPTGRIVYGSVHKASLQTEDDGRTPKKIKTGQNAGQDLYMFGFGLAIPKTPGRDWKDEDWGKIIVAEATASWPGGQSQRRDFAWKCADGDSTEPNKQMKRNVDKVGYPGHWILNFGGIAPPQLFDSTNGSPVATIQQDIMLPGDFAQVFGSVKSNESTQTSGMYLNPVGVCFKGYSPLGRIQTQQAVDANMFGAGAAKGAATMPASTGVSPPAAAPAPVAAPVPAAPPVPVVPAAGMIPIAPEPRRASKDGNSWLVSDMPGWTEDMLLKNGYTLTGG